MIVTGQDPVVPSGGSRSFLSQFSPNPFVVVLARSVSAFLSSFVLTPHRSPLAHGLAAKKAAWDHSYGTISQKYVFIHGLIEQEGSNHA